MENLDDIQYYFPNGIIERLLINTDGNGAFKKTHTFSCEKEMLLLILYTVGDFDQEFTLDETIEPAPPIEMPIWLEQILQEIEFDFIHLT